MPNPRHFSKCFRLMVFATAIAAAGPVLGASQRTFVASTGVDNPACSLGSPCRTFFAAILATISGGEVIVLDSGGYGAVVISQSVSITAPPGIYAGVSVFGGDGITIATSASDIVRLKGLTITNVGAGNSGISLASAGRLEISDVAINGFFPYAGILFAPTASSDLVVQRTRIDGHGGGEGISIQGATGTVARALIEDVTVAHTLSGIVAIDNSQVVVRRAAVVDNFGDGVGAAPLSAGSSTELVLDSSIVSNNGGNGVSAGAPGGDATVTIVDSTLANNVDGVFTTNGASVRLVGSTVTRNGTGISYAIGGTVQSQGNNFIYGNTSDGTPPTLVGSK